MDIFIAFKIRYIIYYIFVVSFRIMYDKMFISEKKPNYSIQHS